MKTPQELLHQALEVGECLLPDAPPGGRSAHPTVFVHGLLGWGAQDALCLLYTSPSPRDTR